MSNYAMLLLIAMGLTILNTATAQESKRTEICDDIDEYGELVVKPKYQVEPEDLCACGDIISLRLRKKNLIKLPECFGNMVELRKLDLKKSTLSGFPDILLSLSWLEELSIAGTNISFLPENLYEMQSLRKLDLQATNISVLPDGLEHIEIIDFRMCDLNKEEQEALQVQYPQTTFFFPSPCNCNVR